MSLPTFEKGGGHRWPDLCQEISEWNNLSENGGGGTCPSQLLRGGHRWPDLSDISEWIKIEGQGIRGHMSLLTF